jgi:hypothetical protein
VCVCVCVCGHILFLSNRLTNVSNVVYSTWPVNKPSIRCVRAQFTKWRVISITNAGNLDGAEALVVDKVDDSVEKFCCGNGVSVSSLVVPNSIGDGSEQDLDFRRLRCTPRLCSARDLELELEPLPLPLPLPLPPLLLLLLVPLEQENVEEYVEVSVLS